MQARPRFRVYIDTLAGVGVGILGCEVGHEGVQGGPRLFHGDTRFQATDVELDPVVAPALELITSGDELLLHQYRNPDIGTYGDICSVESLLSHTDHRIGVAVDEKGLSNNLRIAAEATLPEAVAEHGHRVSPGCLIFLRKECPSKRHINTQKREVVSRDDRPRHFLVPLARAQMQGPKGFGSEAGEYVVFISKVHIVGVGERPELQTAGPTHEEPDEALGLFDVGHPKK